MTVNASADGDRTQLTISFDEVNGAFIGQLMLGSALARLHPQRRASVLVDWLKSGTTDHGRLRASHRV
jgi:hypothetical protein